MLIRGLTDEVANRYNECDWTVFIDTNPSFAIYTELAISAADRLITPVNADDSSRVAANAMLILLHGQNPPHPIYGSWTFAAHAQLHGIAIPKIHLVIGNRLTQYAGAAAAFAALSDATATALFTAYQTNPQYFTTFNPAPTNVSDFRKAYSMPLRDFNTAGIVSAHSGQRLSCMSGGSYVVHGATVQIQQGRVTDCLDAVDAIVERL